MKLPPITRRSIVFSASFVTASILVLAVDLLIFAHPISSAVWGDVWHWYHQNRADITRSLTMFCTLSSKLT
jgi:hypothetical protein